MYANPCLITAGIVPAINYYNVLPYVGSYIPIAIASGCLMTPASGVVYVMYRRRQPLVLHLNCYTIVKNRLMYT